MATKAIEKKRCGECGALHAAEDLEPAFRRPDAFLALTPAKREKAKADNDLCVIRGRRRSRYFVRCTLPVAVQGRSRPLSWGIWAEVSEPAFRKILRVWSDPRQSEVPAIRAKLANRIRGYADTRRLRAQLRLTGPKTRPELTLLASDPHLFARECTRGVSEHRASEWLDLLT